VEKLSGKETRPARRTFHTNGLLTALSIEYQRPLLVHGIEGRLVGGRSLATEGMPVDSGDSGPGQKETASFDREILHRIWPELIGPAPGTITGSDQPGHQSLGQIFNLGGPTYGTKNDGGT